MAARSRPRELRHYCLTWNNPNEPPAAFKAILNTRIDCRYWVFQHERGAQGTPHYQGYIELKKPLSGNALREKIGKPVYVREREGTRDEARNYCMKRDATYVDGPWEGGEWRPEPEKKKTPTDLVNAIKKAQSLKEVVEQYPSYALYHYSNLLKLYQLYEPPHEGPNGPAEVILCLGETGLGKSRYAWKFEDWGLTVGACHLPWFDGYVDHQVLLIDEFNHAKCELEDLLRYLDRYRVLLPVKGGFVWRRACIIVITSNTHPREWYDYRGRREQYAALCRRIKRVATFKGHRDPIISEDEDKDTALAYGSPDNLWHLD
nr:rep protein [Cressdnaviricota sp.]UOF78970.1 rep protein [Cressdnaviricota sp.]UOF79964.1 rep protein [Cressdnaviricota sp.]UOF81229.1 rep protein [Cressdnaviricota sp.]